MKVLVDQSERFIEICEDKTIYLPIEKQPLDFTSYEYAYILYLMRSIYWSFFF
jgi:hypothetical protein